MLQDSGSRDMVEGGEGIGKKKPAENVFCMAFLCSWKGYPCLVPKTKKVNIPESDPETSFP